MKAYLKLIRLIILFIGVLAMLLQLSTFIFLFYEVYLFADNFSFASFIMSYAGLFIFAIGFPFVSSSIRRA